MATSIAKDNTVTPVIRHGMSWADQQDSPGWTAKSPPAFAEDMPEIVLDEQEYDRESRISVFVGGLDYGVDSKQLEEFFTSNNCAVYRVRIQKVNGKSSGKAFLNVADAAALSVAIKLSGTTFAGRAISVKEDVGPRQWRQEEKPVSKQRDSRWQAVKGGKVVDAPKWSSGDKWSDKWSSSNKKSANIAPVESANATTEVPSERKKLQLKPRSKPIETESPATTSGIFGGAKPRDEFAHQPVAVVVTPDVTESVQRPAPRKRAEKPKASAQAPPPVQAAPVVAPPKKKVSNNRFLVESDSE